MWVELPENDPSGEGYRKATITGIVAQNISVKFQDGKENQVKAALIYGVNDYRHLPDGYNDMVEMDNLSEAELLYNLKERYQKEKIFTYVGPTLIVLNPYMFIPELFKSELLASFQKAVRELAFEHKKFPPHVWAIGAATMANLIKDQRNQAIVISGESGAGKTENTKFAMKFLTSMNDSGGQKDPNEVSIEDKVSAFL